MASVRPRKGSQYLFACYTLPSAIPGEPGRRVQRSTRKTDRTDALQVALAYEKAAHAARDRKFTEASARRFLDEIRVVTGLQIGATIGTQEWLSRWLDTISPQVEEKTAKRYREMVRVFLESVGPASAAPISEVTPLQVATWRDHLVSARGMSQITANLTLSFLSAAFREAKTLKLIEANPCDGLRFRKAEAKRQRRDAFTLAQFGAMLDACGADPKLGEFRTLLLILGLTGCRQQEAAQLRWSQVDFDRSRITLTRGKDHSRPHVVPLDGWLQAELRTAFDQAAGLMVMPAIATLDGREVSNAFRRRILPKIGVVQPYANARSDRASGEPARPRGLVLAKLSLHSLRHSLASWLDQTGATPAQRRDILGHRTAEINEGYTHASMDHVRTALGRVTAELAKNRAG